MKQLLKTLTESFGPSGYEDAIRKIVVTEVKPLADEVRVDALGNLIVRKKPAANSKNPKRIMLAAQKARQRGEESQKDHDRRAHG